MIEEIFKEKGEQKQEKVGKKRWLGTTLSRNLELQKQEENQS